MSLFWEYFFLYQLPSLSVLLEAFFILGILAGTDLHCVFWDTGKEGFERQLPNRAILENIDRENGPGIHCDSHLQIAANKPCAITTGQVPHRAYREQEVSGCTTDTAARSPAASIYGTELGSTPLWSPIQDPLLTAPIVTFIVASSLLDPKPDISRPRSVIHLLALLSTHLGLYLWQPRHWDCRFKIYVVISDSASCFCWTPYSFPSFVRRQMVRMSW